MATILMDGNEDKGATSTITTARERPHHHKQSFRQFLRPNGRKVHIAQTPEEHARLKKELHPPEDFDIYIHGTEEHVPGLSPAARTLIDILVSSTQSVNFIPTTKHAETVFGRNMEAFTTNSIWSRESLTRFHTNSISSPSMVSHSMPISPSSVTVRT